MSYSTDVTSMGSYWFTVAYYQVERNMRNNSREDMVSYSDSLFPHLTACSIRWTWQSLQKVTPLVKVSYYCYTPSTWSCFVLTYRCAAAFNLHNSFPEMWWTVACIWQNDNDWERQPPPAKTLLQQTWQLHSDKSSVI